MQYAINVRNETEIVNQSISKIATKNSTFD